jgi:hypothetical protein
MRHAIDRARAHQKGQQTISNLFLGRGLERAELLFEEKSELCYKAPHLPHPPVTTLTRAQHAALSETRTGDRHHIAIHSSCMQHVQLFPD